MTSDSELHRAFWDRLASSDPLWAILSDPSRRGRQWDLTTFFRTGEREISTLMHQLARLSGHEPAVVGDAALDFGCGVGRLSQALAKYFGSVVGVDVSDTMIAHARRLNRRGNSVSYVVNERPDLRVLGERRFDLVYTDLVLQHMPPDQALGYVSEFVRVLRPGGFLVFQLPSHRRPELAPEVTPMPTSAYRAAIEVTSRPDEWARQVPVRLGLDVRNASDVTWDQQRYGALRVGNHWLSASGEMLVQDDGRAWLPEVVRPGERVPVVLEVTVPAGGEALLLLELDIVHEGHSWFADKGSPTVRLKVTGGTERAIPDHAATPVDERWDDDLLLPFLGPRQDDAGEVDFPMFGVPRDELVAFVTARGGELLLCEPDDRGGREWAGFRYFFRKG